ncbi:BNR repeat-like domain-containing protein [Salinihabitans flavidus]|uniref:BNR repeat-like domain-containing protein n=1 Tax=Salinihabitans flavidus TaxID=569882 RepID=A0A1H8RSA0_9RHOB|nr:exo-alpha-sialidase [Salinihabitans flavidus]SEO69206.1 BNR repeat-like domain-containing protein [Salinihabitans flavidus]
MRWDLLIRAGLLGTIALLAVAGLWLRAEPPWRFAPAGKAALNTGDSFETVFHHTSKEGVAHAPALVNDGTEVIWFDGLREGHNDVRILQAQLESGEVSDLLTRQALSAQMVPPQTILTLGNTVDDGTGDGWLATVVSLGGWAAASIAHVANGRGRKLSLSPILNRSNLTKSPVVPMSGGWRMLPAYFEMEGGHGVAALIDERGRVRAQAVMRGKFRGIQPMIVPMSDTRAVALLRRFDRSNDRLLASWTSDGGQSWNTPEPLNLPNPSAPVAAVPLADGRLLMLFNDAPDSADTLRFASSADGGRSWTMGRILDGPGQGPLRYPMMTVLADGRIAVTYSAQGKTEIRVHVLSADWALAE